nr:hypothetical protein 5 [bacterium]
MMQELLDRGVKPKRFASKNVRIRLNRRPNRLAETVLKLSGYWDVFNDQERTAFIHTGEIPYNIKGDAFVKVLADRGLDFKRDFSVTKREGTIDKTHARI